MTICVVPETLETVLQAHRALHKWTYRVAADAIGTSEPNVHRWAWGKSVPDRSWAPNLARFLEVSEQEILDALNESARAARQRDAAQTLQLQIDLMRRDVQRMMDDAQRDREDAVELRAEVQKLNQAIAELQAVLSRKQGDL